MRPITQTTTDTARTYTFTWVTNATDSYLRIALAAAPGLISIDDVFYESDLGCTRFIVDPALQSEFETFVDSQEPSEFVRV